MALMQLFFVRAANGLSKRFTGGSLGPRRFAHLPASYHVGDAWKSRSDSRLMQQIRVEEFYVELRKRFDSTKSGSALDIELFANKIERVENAQQLVELLGYLRASLSAATTREGISHATIRLYMQLELYDELLKILSDKPKYGVFLDNFTANLLMDKFLELNRPQDAVRISIDLMLQEDFSSLINRDLALTSCYSFLQNPDWAAIAPYKSEEAAPDTGEETIIYVKGIRNPHFDDHFDIKEPKHLLGKILFLAGKQKNDSIGRSAQIAGLGLYEKWEKGANLLESFLSKSDDGAILQESYKSFVDALRAVPKTPEGTAVTPALVETPPIIPVPGTDPNPPPLNLNALLSKVEEIGKQMTSKGLLKEGGALDLVQKQLTITIDQHASQESSRQVALYEKWTSNRETEVDRLTQRYEMQERLQELQRKRTQLQEEEDLLFFFERKNQWEKMLTPEARNAMADAEAAEGSTYDFRAQDPGYNEYQIKEPKTYSTFRWWKRPQEIWDASEAVRNK